MDPHTQRAEAERWLGIAAKLLTARDFLGSKTFAMRAREADPNNAVHGQILAVVDTVLAGEKRVNANQQPDWYAVLQLPRLVRDADLIADHYRRLVLCLNPERNRFPFADYALQLVMDAWSVLSDPTKKWLFDNELALYLQQSEATGVSIGGSVVVSGGGGGGGGGDGGGQLNTFQFFQPQPQPQSQQQQQQQIWQQQEFMPLQSQAEQQSHQQQQQQILPTLWQTRDQKGGGGGGGGGGVIRDGGTNTSPIIPTVVQVPQGMPQGNPSQPQVSIARVPVATTRVGVAGVDGNASSNVNTSNNNTTRINNNDDDDVNVNEDGTLDGEDKVVDEIDCFWTTCPYCFYIFEYPKMYQECTLRCQNCRRGFHAVQIPNPPPISPASKGGDKGKGKEKEKGDTFCCWGFYPLGFSMTAWKKQNRIGNSNGSSNWVPFAPMFNGPVGGGGDGGGGGGASDGPKWVYFDDDDEVDDPESGDKDSSDGDWRTLRQEKGKKRKKRRKRKASFGGRKLGRPPSDNGLKPVTTNVPRGGGVSVGGEDMDDGSDAPEVVVGLAAGDKSDARKTASAALARKLSRRRRAKDMGRLDLNVEFNTDGGDHAPTVSATNGDEDGIENILFFDGFDEFLSTLPILDVNGEEKSKPS